MARKRYAIPQYGTVIMAGKEYYRTRIEDADGKRVALYGRTREELYDKVLEAREQIEDNTFRRSSPTVKEYCEKWLLLQSAQVRATTLTDYTSKVNRHIIKPLGHMNIADVTADDIRLALVPVSQKSASVYKSVNILYKSIFAAAKESKVIQDNPTIYLSGKNGGVPQKEKNPLTDDQVERLLDAIRGLPPYPMMMKVDFRSIKNVGKNPKGLFVTWIVNWLIKPFTMYGMASLFFFVVFKAFITPELATEYLAGAVLLGAAPCTAMVFVWSALTKGDPAYTVVQVATNDLIILVAFVPIVKFLLGVSNVLVPWDTLILSVVLFVVIPLSGGMLTRYFVTQKKGKEYFENTFVKKFDGITTVGLLLTLVLIFAFQGQVILDNPLHIVLIAVPLILQTFLIFSIAYGVCWLLKLPHRIAAPAGMIGASNFFELAVAVAVALFGTTSPAALATTVGVLTEVPVMLFLVKIANKTKGRFPA